MTVLGFGFSAFFTANIAGYFIGSVGVMNTFRIFGIAFIVLITLLALPWHFPPQGWIPKGWTPEKGRAAGQIVCECDPVRWSVHPHFTACGSVTSSAAWPGSWRYR